MPVTLTFRKYFIKTLKVLGWIVFSVVILLVLTSFAIQLPYVQNKLLQTAVGFLKDKVKTEVRLRHISLSFPKRIELEGIYIEDQSKDTLLYIGKLGIDTDLWALTQKTIELNQIQIDTLTANVGRQADSERFNFTYIIDAFNDTTAVEPDTVANEPWQFAIEDIGLTQADVKFLDGYGGNAVRARIGNLEVSLDKFDLTNSIIAVDDVLLTQSDVHYALSKSNIIPAANMEAVDTSAGFQFGIQEVNLENVNATFSNALTAQVITANVSKLSVDADEFDLQKQIIKLDNVSLENTFVSYHQMQADPIVSVDSAVIDSSSVSPSWLVDIEEISFVNDIVQYYDFNKPAQGNAVDFSRLWFTQLNLAAEDFHFHGIEDLAGTVKSMSLRDKSGFAIQNFQTEFALTDSTVTLHDFNFTTPHTSLTLEADATFPSFATLSTTYPDASINLNIKPSSISVKDLLSFAPTALDSMPVRIPPNTLLKIDASVNGLVKNLKLDHLLVNTLSSTSLQASGTIQGLPDFSKSVLKVSLDKFYTSEKDIKTIMPDTLLPKSIVLPTWINLVATVNGTLNAPAIRSDLTTNLGNVAFRAKLNFDSTARQNYDGYLTINKFQLGKFLKQDSTIGNINLTASAKGAGFSVQKINALLKLTVHSLQYNDYTYKDLKVTGNLKSYLFKGKAILEDKNLNLALEGNLDYTGEVPSYNFTFDLNNADFRALNLSQRPLKARGRLDVNIATSDFKMINGKINLRKVAIFNGQKLYAVDSLLYASLDQRGKSEISIQSDLLSGDFKGNINIFGLTGAIRQHVNQYFSLRDSTLTKPAEPQNFSFNLVIKNTDLLTEIIFPELDPFVPGKIAGEFNSAEQRLNFTFNLARIKYSGLGMDSVGFKLLSNKESLDFTFALQKLSFDTLKIETIKLTGNVMHDSIYTRFQVLDSLKREKYLLGGVFNSFEDAFQFKLLQRQVVLNYDKWSTPLYNTLRFTEHGLYPNNFYITRDEQRILMTKRETADSTLSLAFRKVNLKNITSLVEGTTPLDGDMDGNVTLAVAEKGAFNSTLFIRSLEVLDKPWGDLALALGKTSTGPLNMDLRIEGENMDFKAAGYLTSNTPQPEIHFLTTLSKFNLASIEPLTMNQLKDMKGQLLGEIKIDGPTSKPAIDGYLNFKDASFTPTLIGSKFVLEDEDIRLTGSGLTLNTFEIRDDKGNIARIDGTIKTKSFTTFDLSLAVTAKDFQLINTTEDDNDLFYGNVRINTNAKITGTSDFPKIQLDASLSKDSQLTYVIPETEKALLEQEGIVKFVDRDAYKDPFLASINPEDTVKSKFTGMELTANIELNDNETFNVVIDPATGDKLSVKGNATLTLDIDETGDMQLTGRYEITQGTYNLSFYKLVKRQFSIVKGSTIVWTGDVLKPEMDIRALFNVETSPIDLIANQSAAGADASYRQRLPFYVYLIIKGNLLTPLISFELDMPQDKQNAFGGAIYAKIKDINTRESDLNKQVFALLILKRFISDNPFDSQGGSDVASTARTSVSKILTDQLNRLSENVKGVQLSFDVKSYEDYSTGTAQGNTELQLGMSKTLLNDRLVVKVAGNLDVEGNTSNQSSFADYIGDLALEYKLTPDGRLRITGFRNSNYDMIDGELIETGAGFIYIKDYDAFSELFKANVQNN